MDSKEALEKLSKYNNHYVKDKEYLFIDIESEEWKAILKDLEMLEILKEWLVYDEYEDAIMTYTDIPLDLKEKIKRWLDNEL